MLFKVKKNHHLYHEEHKLSENKVSPCNFTKAFEGVHGFGSVPEPAASERYSWLANTAALKNCEIHHNVWSKGMRLSLMNPTFPWETSAEISRGMRDCASKKNTSIVSEIYKN